MSAPYSTPFSNPNPPATAVTATPSSPQRAHFGGRILSTAAIKNITARPSLRLATGSNNSPIIQPRFRASPPASTMAPAFCAVLHRPSIDEDDESLPSFSTGAGPGEPGDWVDDEEADDVSSIAPSEVGSVLIQTATREAFTLASPPVVTSSELALRAESSDDRRAAPRWWLAPPARGTFVVMNATSPISPATPDSSRPFSRSLTVPGMRQPKTAQRDRAGRRDQSGSTTAPGTIPKPTATVPVGSRRRHSRNLLGSHQRNSRRLSQRAIGSSSSPTSPLSPTRREKRPVSPDLLHPFPQKRKLSAPMGASVRQLVRVPVPQQAENGTTVAAPATAKARQVLATKDRRAAVYEVVDEADAEAWRAQLRELKPQKTSSGGVLAGFSVKKLLRFRRK